MMQRDILTHIRMDLLGSIQDKNPVYLLVEHKGAMDISETSSVSSVLELEDISCPICLKHFNNLQGLNDHLDTDHGFEGDSRSESTLTTPTQSQRMHLSPQRSVHMSHSRSSSFEVNKKQSITSAPPSSNKVKKPQLEIDKTHWEKFAKGKTCHHCYRKLNPSTGLINCNKCGKLFCRRHCTNIIKLNPGGQFDPRGKRSRWYNCCHNCFISRPGYNDYGESVDLTNKFVKIRNKRSEDSQLIRLQLENRLVRLIDGLIILYKKYKLNGNVLSSVRFNIEKNALEQRITSWRPDNGVTNCHICSRQFNMLIRKHHCRLCGYIICDSTESGCSNAVSLMILRKNAKDLPFQENIQGINEEMETNGKDITLRLCSNCLKLVYIPRKFQEDIHGIESPLLIKYRSLQNVSRTITYLLPQFQDLLQREEVEKISGNIPNPTNLQELMRVRERLLKSFNTYNTLTKQMMLLSPTKESERRIQTAIQIVSSGFINQKILPLKNLGTMLSPNTSGRSSPSSITTPNGKDMRTTMEVKTLTEMMGGLTIKEVKQYREELMVLKEQSFLINSMIAESKRQRKFDEIKTLSQNLEELNKRSQELEGLLGDHGFT